MRPPPGKAVGVSPRNEMMMSGLDDSGSNLGGESDLRQKIIEKNVELQGVLKERNELQRDNEELRENVQRLENECKRLDKVLGIEIEKSNRRIRELEAEAMDRRNGEVVADRSQREIDLMDQVIGLKRTLGEKNDEIAKKLREVQELEQRIEDMQEGTQKDHRELRNANKNMSAELERLRNYVKELEERNRKSSDEISGVNARMKKLEMEHGNALSDNQRMKRENQNIQEMISALRNERDDFQSSTQTVC
jgi:chromosome segregation ATPase